MVREVFGISDRYPMTAGITLVGDQTTTFFRNTNAAGGKGFFIQRPNTQILKQVLSQAIPVKDVDIQLPLDNYVKMFVDYEGGVTYLHKVKDGRDIYFIANSTNAPVSTKVVLRTGSPHRSVEPSYRPEAKRQHHSYRTERTSRDHGRSDP